MPKFQGCTVFWTRVIRQRISLKIIVFSMEKMETPCWWLSQNVSSHCQSWKNSHRHLIQHVGYSELENLRRIDIFMHVTCYRCHAIRKQNRQWVLITLPTQSKSSEYMKFTHLNWGEWYEDMIDNLSYAHNVNKQL